MRTAFKPLVQAAIDARRQIEQEFAQLPRGITAAMRAGAQATKVAGAEEVGAVRATVSEEVKARRDALRQAAADAKAAQREQLAEYKATLREKQNLESAAAALSRQRAQALYRQYAADQRNAERDLDRFATRTSYRAARFLTPNLPIASVAHRAGREIMSGLGIDTSFSGALQRNIQLESAASMLANKSRLSGQNVSTEEIEGRVREVSTKYGVSKEDAAGALEAFVDKTGDLRMGLTMLDKAAEGSIVMSTNIHDLGSAMAEASKQMGDVPNKAERLGELIETFGVQADRGFISMQQFAKSSPKVLAQAGLLAGDIDTNQAKLGTLMQVAMLGGSGTAPQAGTAVQAFINTILTPARQKDIAAAAKKSGIKIDLFSDNGSAINDPFEIARRALLAAGNGGKANLTTLASMFNNIRGRSVIQGFAKEFNAAGGGEAGIAAVNRLIGTFMGHKMTPEERQDALDTYHKSTKYQAAQFQNELDAVANEVRASLMPALQEAKPYLESFVKGMGELAGWVATHPGEAIVGAIVASIGRAGLESALRSVLEGTIKAAVTGMGGRGMQAVGTVGLGVALGAAVGTGIYAEGVSSIEGEANKTKNTGGILNELRAASARPVTKKQKEELFRKVLDQEEAWKTDVGNYGAWDAFKGWFGASSKKEELTSRAGMVAEMRAIYDTLAVSPEVTKGNERTERITGKSGESPEELKRRILAEDQKAKQDREGVDALKETNRLLGRTLKVNVQNAKEIRGEGGSEDPTAPGGDNGAPPQ